MAIEEMAVLAVLENKMSQQEPTGWIQTFTGKKFYPGNPKLEDICIEDIAHSLSMMCRFTGHCREFYSVASHSIHVSNQCSKENQLHGLLHDASEAYITDVSRPVKRMKELSGYRDIENALQKIICKRFGLPEVEPEEVKMVDVRMLSTEARDLMAPLHIDWVQPSKPYEFKIKSISPRDANEQFIERFNELMEKR